MKPFNLHSWIGGAAVMLMLSLAASCTDEEMFQRPDTGNGIAFLPSIVNKGWSAGDSTQTRAAVPASRHSVTELRNAQGGRALYLHTTETDSIATPAAPDTARIATRGALVTTTTAFEKQYGSFGVLAWAYQGEWSDTQEPNYIDNAEATANGGTYGFNPPYFWPGDAYNMAFFAYAPYDKDGTIFSEKQGAPTLIYSVPTDITEQKDLLAYWIKEIDEKNKRETIDLNFSHLCTAIKFKVGEGLENAITSISIKNVYGSGTYSVAEEKWTPTGEANGAYTLTIDSKNTSEGTELTTGENIFMMIPQTLPEDATIEVTYKDEESGEEQTLIASIAEKEWTKGYTVTYILSRMEILEEYHFKITPELTVDYRGKNNIKYSISSYKNRTVNGVTENNIPVKWKYIAYKENDGEWITPTNRPYYPQWLGSFYTSGTGERTEYTIKVDGSGSQYKNKQNEILQATNSVEDIYDLSTRGGETNVNTANCYIVNAPGTYSLPLVYGNAIKNGQPNESAYQTANTSETILSTFINHLGREITSPYIYENSDAEDNKLVPQSAELLWQDAQNLVTDVKLSSGKESLQFTVAKETIQQGNAVLAIRDNKEQIMWSWHIWVTDYNPYEEKENITTGRHFFSRYLGWCYLSSNFHEQRTVTLRFEQEESGEKIEMTITQTEHQDGTNGNNPYYQFGRKDPQLPAQNCGVERTENKTWYDTNGNSSRELLLMPEGTEVNGKHPDNIMVNIVDFILNPHKTYIKYRYDTKHYYLLNLWDMERDDSEEINNEVSHKTIYDPSPVGYQVPSSGILTNYPNKDDLVLCGYRGTDAYTSGAYNFGDLREVDKSYNVWSASSLNKSSAWHIYSTNS